MKIQVKYLTDVYVTEGLKTRSILKAHEALG
jgi:hypothetical protein